MENKEVSSHIDDINTRVTDKPEEDDDDRDDE